MSKMHFIDSGNVNGISDALSKAIERRGMRFKAEDFDFPTTDEEIPDIDPYLGSMPRY